MIYVEIIIAVFAVFAFVLSLMKFSNDRNTSTVENTTEIKNLNGTLREIIETNRESHERIWDRLDEHTDSIADHEKRIYNIEHK